MQIAGSMSGPTASTADFGRIKPSCVPVIGVNERGEKRFLAIEDGVRTDPAELTVTHRSVLISPQCM